MHQYAYHLQQGRSIHSSCQLDSFANDGNDKLIHITGGLQCIQTVDGYVFHLSIRDGLPYLSMRPYRDVEYVSPPHVILTSDVDWCWTNIVSTLLLLGIRSLNALLAHSIAVNTSYRSSLVLHTWAYKPLVVLDLVIWRK
jgi:hypothetical protein